MIGSIIEFAIGWFVTYKMCGIVGAKGILATIIKIIGVLLMIGACLSLAHSILKF